MTIFLHALWYLSAWLLTFGLFTIVIWYVRYAVAVIVALFPAFGVFWFLCAHNRGLVSGAAGAAKLVA
jgi:hypothetical protein